MSHYYLQTGRPGACLRQVAGVGEAPGVGPPLGVAAEGGGALARLLHHLLRVHAAAPAHNAFRNGVRNPPMLTCINFHFQL